MEILDSSEEKTSKNQDCLNKDLSSDNLEPIDPIIEECRVALKINPEDSENHYRLAVILQDKGLLGEAINGDCQVFS